MNDDELNELVRLANAAFQGTARTAVPALVAEVRRLRALTESLAAHGTTPAPVQFPEPAGPPELPPNVRVGPGTGWRLPWLVLHNLLVHPLMGLWQLLTLGLAPLPRWLEALHDATYPEGPAR